MGNKWDKFGDVRELEIPGGNPRMVIYIYYRLHLTYYIV